MLLVLQIFVLFLIFQTNYFSFAVSSSSTTQCKTNSNDPSKVVRTIKVSQSGGSKFTTITAALNSIPSGNDQWIKIALDPGTYKEQIKIPEDKQCIILEGSGRSTTTITYDAHKSTFDSTTFAAYADNFVARGITFTNTYNLPAGINPNPPVPAVALAARGDKQAFFSCGFEGYQDTLWDDSGRHYFRSCYIEGAVDFIWGAGQSVYQQCDINVTGGGYLTAQGRESADDDNGYVFRQCNIFGQGHGCLGRPYREYARVIFIDSKLDYAVDPQGWYIWKQHGHENDITFAEVNCTGIGADDSKRVPWMKKSLSKSELKQFRTKPFIDKEGWIAKLPLEKLQDCFNNKYLLSRKKGFFKLF